jgi:hypothetical protein
MSKNRHIEIRDVGPIQHLDIPLPDGGGFVVLRGPNGAGKSHALQAVNALIGEGRPVSRRGSAGAMVDGLGARLSVGRRANLSGTLECEALDGEDPSLLVDPGYKDAGAADAARVKALLRLSRASLDASAFASLVGSDERLREICRESSLEASDVPTMAARIKLDIEGAARKKEQEADNKLAKAAAIIATIKEIEGEGEPQSTESAEEARTQHTKAVRAHSALQATQQQNAKLLASAERAKADLEAMGTRGTDQAIVDADATCDVAEREERDALADVERIKLELRNAEERAAAATRDRERVSSELLNQQEAAKQRETLNSVIAASEGIEPVSEESLAELEAAITTASRETDRWAVRERTVAKREEAERLNQEGTKASEEGVELRDAARGTERIILDAVSKVCPDGMELEEGRLYVNTEDGRELFSELSDGERWRLALEIGAKAVGGAGLLVVRQQAYEGLQPSKREEIAEHARRLGVVILTACADDAALRAEVE